MRKLFYQTVATTGLALALAGQGPKPASPVFQPGVSAEVLARYGLPGGSNSVTPPKDSESEPRLDLEFSGGTVVEFVKAVSAQLPSPVNIIIPTEHQKLAIPKISVHRVTLPDLLAAVGNSTIKPVLVQQGIPGGGSGYSEKKAHTGFRFQTTSSSQPAIWTLVVDGIPEPAKTSPPLKSVRYYNLAKLVADKRLTPEDITTAIQTGHRMSTSTEQQMELRYHTESQLLIARGEPWEISLVAEVLNGLGLYASPGGPNQAIGVPWIPAAAPNF